MRYPCLESAYSFSPGSKEFHREILKCFEVFVRDNDFNEPWERFNTRDQEMETKYGYGGKLMFPYGYFHPTKVLDKCLKQYSRGKLLERRLPFLKPSYIYSYSREGELVSIEHMMKRSKVWKNPVVVTLVCKGESTGAPLMLTYYSTDVKKEAPQVKYIAWAEEHGPASYTYIVQGGIFAEQFKFYQCTTEIQQMIKHELICDRYEFSIIPNKEGSEYLLRNTFITQ